MAAVVTPEQVLEAVTRRWNAIGQLRRLVPGSLWFGRVPPEVAQPYASLVITPEEHTYYSNFVLAPFNVEITVWSAGGPDQAAATIQRHLGQVFDWKQELLTMPSRKQRVRIVRPTPGSVMLEESLREAGDVCVSRMAYRIVVEGR